LINVIEKYNLQQYDSPEVEIQKIKRADTVFTKIDKKAVKEAKDSVKAKADSALYTPHNQSAPVKAAPVVLAPVQSTQVQPAANQPAVATPAPAQHVSAQQDPAVVNKMYTVKQGDTLYSLSRRFGLTVDDMKTMNNLPDFNIKIGQKLVVVK
jgi:LysM repeat protein